MIPRLKALLQCNCRADTPPGFPQPLLQGLVDRAGVGLQRPGVPRRFDNRLRGDDEFARQEQIRAQSRGDIEGNAMPTYCNSRYYKILAGGNSQGGVGCGGSE